MQSHRNSISALGLIAMVVFLLLVGISFGTARLSDKSGQNFHALLVNFAFSLLSIAGTVLVVDRLNEARDVEEERRRLVRDMSASSGPIAQRGARELAELNGLKNGYLRGRDLSGASLAGTRLEGLVIAGGKLIGAHLEDADLTSADLTGCTLNLAYFDRATLESAKLASSHCINTSFSAADLNSADLSHGNFQGASFKGADLTYADLQDGNFQGADFKDAKLAGARCMGGKFDLGFASRFGLANFQLDGEVYTCRLDGPLAS